MSSSICPTSDRIHVLVVDDHPAIGEALREKITDEMDMTTVGISSSSDEALEIIESENVDVAVVDLSLSEESGLTLLSQLRLLYPGTHTLVYSMHDEMIYAERALQAGARGYLMKTAPANEVLSAIRTVHRGQTYLSDDVRTACIQNLTRETETGLPVSTLTERERAVFEGLGQGKSLAVLADELGITRKTAEHHRRQAKEKLDLDSVGQLRQHAIAWIHSDPDINANPEEATSSNTES